MFKFFEKSKFFENPVIRQITISLLVLGIILLVPLTDAKDKNDKNKELILKIFISLGAGLTVNNILVLGEVKSLNNKLISGEVNINDLIINRVLSDVGNFIDEDILFVFKDFFNPFTSNLKNIRKREFVIDTNVKRQFEILYISVLEHLPEGRLFATSSVSRDYFWKETIEEESVERSSQKFLMKEPGRNKIERIFIVKDSDIEEDRNRLIGVIRCQAECGIDVYCVNASNLPERLVDFFLVVDCVDDHGLNFTWETKISPGKYTICGMHVYATPDKIHENYRKFLDLKGRAIPWKEYFNSLGLSISA
jgi:hypothetical protein